jgi:hypothetical protein
MSTYPLRLTGFARGSHVEVTTRARDALGSSGAFILDYHMFSNAILCLNFEIAATRLPVLAVAISEAAIRLDGRSQAELDGRLHSTVNDSLTGAPSIEGSLSINLIHDEPVLRIEVPAVPG